MMMLAVLLRIVWWILLIGQFDIPQALSASTDAGQGPYILLGNTNKIQRISLDGTKGTAVHNDTGSDIIGIDFDSRDGYMFWTDVAKKSINRANLNGSNRTTLIKATVRSPEGLAWDWVTKKVYWTDSERRRISVYDPEHNIRKVVTRTGSNSAPKDIALDPMTGWMFWIDLGEESEIERVSMDGTNHTTIISTDIVQPTGLAIDYDTLTLFWCDAALDRIESSKLDGSHRAVLLEENIIFHPLSITFFNGSLFWGDWVVGAVYTLRVANPEENGLVRAILGMELSGIKVVSESRQAEVTTPCGIANGNCSHLCLISATASKGYTCACPKHFHMDSNQRDCIRDHKDSSISEETTGSCLGANHTTCCTEGDCQGYPRVCSCSTECRSLNNCCLDFDLMCPASSPGREYLLVATQGGIVSLELNGESQRTLVSGEQHTNAVDYDISSSYIYWTDVTAKRIRRSFLNGSDVVTILSSGIHTPDGIAVDWINKMLYWTDAHFQKIELFDLIHGHRKVLFFTGGDTIPRTIIVDPTTRWFYWSDWGEEAYIDRASMDGQGRERVVSSALVWPNGLTIDIESQLLYWADAKLDKIESSNVDGTNRHTLTDLGIFHPFSLTVLRDELYWSEWERDIVVIGSLGSAVYIKHSTHLNGTRPMGIQAVSTTKQPLVPNPCLTNGTCSHLCLLSAVSVDGYTCACPDELELSPHSNHCIGLQDNDKFPGRTLTAPKVQPSLITAPGQPLDGNNAAFKEDILPITLAVATIVLSATVVAMFVFLIASLAVKKRNKVSLSSLKRRQAAVPNDYATVQSNTSSQPAVTVPSPA